MSASHGRRNQSGASSFLQFWFSAWSPGLEVGNLDTSSQSATSSPHEEICIFLFLNQLLHTWGVIRGNL